MTTLHKLRSVLAIIATVAVALTSGCATYRHIADYPQPNTPAALSVEKATLSKMSELPVGAYYDDAHQVVVVGHQKGVGVGMMFGLVGVLVADSMNKSSGEKAYGESARSEKVQLTALCNEALSEELAAVNLPGLTQGKGPGAIQVNPFSVFTVLTNGNARLFVIVKAETRDAKGEVTWAGRFYAPADGAYKLEGNEGWMAADRYPQGAKIALRKALHACVLDLQGKLSVKRKATVEGLFPYLGDKYPMKMNVLVCDENDKEVVFRLASGDAFLPSGTYAVDKADFKFEKAEFADPRK